MTDTPKDVIRQARELEPDFDEHLSHISSGPGPFEGISDKELALAIDTIDLHGLADDSAGSVDEVGYFARVGPFILGTNTQGFRSLGVFGSPEAAQQELQQITGNEPVRTIELVLRFRTNAHGQELDDFLGHASETLFSDRGGIFDERDGVEVRYEYEPTGSHWRDVSFVRMYGEMHARPFHPAAAGLPGGNELSPAEAVVQAQPNSTQRG